MNSEANPKTIAVVVPFLNEQDNIPEMYRRLDALFSSMPERGQFLFVDDGSSDGSVAWLKKQAERVMFTVGGHSLANFNLTRGQFA